ncbi:MAG: hypothetical protein KDC53_03620 [Saprospiraceae bacterium]|nr:hypothetical protein [Saprospiraceae bacterium]
MPNKKKILAASAIILLLLSLKWLAPLLPRIITLTANTSFLILLFCFAISLVVILFQLVRILVNE